MWVKPRSRSPSSIAFHVLCYICTIFYCPLNLFSILFLYSLSKTVISLSPSLPVSSRVKFKPSLLLFLSTRRQPPTAALGSSADEPSHWRENNEQVVFTLPLLVFTLLTQTHGHKSTCTRKHTRRNKSRASKLMANVA